MEQNPVLNAQSQKNTSKVFGWILVVGGILIIVLTIIFAIAILTGRANPPKVLSVQAPTINLPTAAESIDTSALPPQIANAIKQPQNNQNSIKILSDDVMTKLINMGVFYILAMLLLSAGSKIASIGVQLTKDIKITPKE